MFISLFGIRVALAVKGDLRHTDFKILALNSFMYGVFFFVVVGGLVLLANAIAVLVAMWQVGVPISLDAFKNTPQSTQVAFALIAVSIKIAVVVVVLTVTYAIMAVPLANAAREAGHRTPSNGFFYGLGRSFLPLFCIFFVSFFLQFYFELLTLLFAVLPLVVSIISIVTGQALPDFDLDIILQGIAALAGLLWLNSWIWSASALALLKFDGSPEAQRKPVQPTGPETETDIRALRKSRERSF
ncbi:hypothetical protein [Roseibium sp. RKSG952]|uniref:hypothetical protein n=1 Tax=Roseibium sp. RKSG952 TaxID=2529384 RepID=UPI0012BBB444|nr:hypothetical protein [Roseibium sp. RKSG952]MTI01232.1 hypothetical protein [Roseibium sp. RKSG952]